MSKSHLQVTFDHFDLKAALFLEQTIPEQEISFRARTIVAEALRCDRISGFVAKTQFSKEATSSLDRLRILAEHFHRFGLLKRFPDLKTVNRAPSSSDNSDSKNELVTLHRMRNAGIKIIPTLLLDDLSTFSSRRHTGDYRTNEIIEADMYHPLSDFSVRYDECCRYIWNVLGTGFPSGILLDEMEKEPVIDKTTCKRFSKHIAEESDAQAIAAHYACGFDLFCTNDRGKNAGSKSVMTAKNKQRLRERFGIVFCNLEELATIIENL